MSEMSKLQVVSKLLKDGDEIEFGPVHKRYGRAEFTFCLRYLRGKLKRVFITPKQQEVEPICYEIDASYGADSFKVGSWTHKGINEPHPWFWFWCKKHRGPAFHLYVPPNANILTVQTLSTLCLHFDRKEGQ